MPITTKSELLAAIDRSWSELQALLAKLTDEEMTARDAAGWTVTDHLVHLAAWERSASFFLMGRPRHEGLGVEASVYLAGDEEATNAAVQQQRPSPAPAEALAELAQVHRQMLALLAPLTDADLRRPSRSYLRGEPGDGGDRPAIDVVYGNTAYHFAEHAGWLRALVGRIG